MDFSALLSAGAELKDLINIAQFPVLKFIAMGLAIGLGVIGPGIGLGLATQAIIQSIARQPESEGQISKYFYIGAGLIEACAIYALLVVILIGFVL